MQNILTKRIIELGENYNLPDSWLTQRSHLYSEEIVPLSAEQASSIQATIEAIESVVDLPAFQNQVLPGAKKTTQRSGVLFGYDFHLTPKGAKLIEINTNAGGGFLMGLLDQAQSVKTLKEYEVQLLQMFLTEWHKHSPDKALGTIAIVDIDPINQYFYPEFLLFQALFEKHGIQCVVVDPSAFSIHSEKLCIADIQVDLVYNRLTDFDLSNPAHVVLKTAYQQNLSLITPHPEAHALYANKLNLILFSDADFLRKSGATEHAIQQLQETIPQTYRIEATEADKIWASRKQYFFKPISGFGGKGVYRGKNMTKKVFKDILEADYIGQEWVPPSEIIIKEEAYKMDLRAYVYEGKILSFASRLYQGQTTNLRTAGGGFASVRVL